MNNIKNKYVQFFSTIITSFIGCLLFSYAFYGFFRPSEIAIGGIGGLSAAINSSFGMKMGFLLLLINIPLLTLSFIFIGKKFAINTTLVIIGASAVMDYIMPFFPQYHGERLLSTVFGSCFLGIGIALIFTCGFTTGGTDIIGRLIQLKFPFFSIGKLMMITDFVIICVSSYIYTLGDGPNNGLESAMYGLISTFIYTKVIDTVLYGIEQTKTVHIVTDKYNDICEAFISKIGNGLTTIPAQGAYSKKQKQLLICVVRANEFSKVKTLVKEIDKNAFIIVFNSSDVFGGKFKSITE